MIEKYKNRNTKLEIEQYEHQTLVQSIWLLKLILNLHRVGETFMFGGRQFQELPPENLNDLFPHSVLTGASKTLLQQLDLVLYM